jgi:hypothetical protein
MWSNQHTIETSASKQAIWNVWRDVANWPSWDEAVQWCKLDGEFKTGATYTLKPIDGPAVKAVIKECEPYRRDVTYFDCVATPIQPLISELTFIRNKQSWGYVFRYGFFEVPKDDFDLIARHLQPEAVHAR